MTEEQLRKGIEIKEQISKLVSLVKRLQKDYDEHKDSTDKHLLETLSLCREAVEVLIEIDTQKFKNL